jgi:hypothetical protein
LKSRGGFFPVKRTSILAIVFAALTIFSTSCGQSDYLQSVQLSAQGATAGGSYNLPGVDVTLQLQAWAIYHSGKQVNVTNNVTWNVTTVGTDQSGNTLPAYGPNTVPISPNGLMQDIVPLCTWTDAIETSNGTTGPANPPVWEYTGYYQIVVNYRQFTSNPVGVGVGSVASNNSPIGGCGPTDSSGS